MAEESPAPLPPAEESSEVETEPAVEPEFICECAEWWRSACEGEPFYKEFDGRRYCVLHYLGEEKSADFKTAIQRKLNGGNFDFRGVWFPDEVDFSEFKFSTPAAFERATFSAGADFSYVEFGAEAEFSYATFGAGADFSYANFTAWADFSVTVFSAKADFNDAVFSAGVDFSITRFGSEADFASTTFGKDADFRHAKFSADAIFAEAKFGGTAFFLSTEFGEDAFFDSATFSGGSVFQATEFMAGAYFSPAMFSAGADFYRARFSAGADFSLATFAEEADFRFTTLNEGASFSRAVFSDAVSFCGRDRYLEDGAHFNETALGENPSLDFQHAKVEKPDRVSFHTVALRPHWFVNVDSRKFVFTDVTWEWDSISIKSEIESLEKKKVYSPRRLLAITCRQLAENAETNNRYEEASRFRYWAMDLARHYKWEGLRFWKTDWLHVLYWAVSGYGERILRALGVLAAIWFIFALLYTQVGFVENPKLGLPRAITYSLGVMSLQRPEPRPFTDWAHALVTLEMILGPVQAALLVLAIRRKFMR